MASFSTLTEDFTTFDTTTKFTNWGGANVTNTSSQINLSNTTGTTNYYGYNTQATYDLTGAAVSIEIISLPSINATDTSFSVGCCNVEIDTNNRYYWEYAYSGGNALIAYKVTAGSYNAIASMAYNATNHKYLRIREASGTVYYDYSANGTSWTNLASIATTGVAVTALVWLQGIGHWAVVNNAYTASFDNLNILPSAGANHNNLLLLGVG